MAWKEHDSLARDRLPKSPDRLAKRPRPDDPDEDFTLEHYREILAAITSSHRTLSFRDVAEMGRSILDLERFVIVRHDVEFSLDSALNLAELDHEAGVRSTFFLLLSSDYNLFEESGARTVRRILDLGHDIGFHYDLGLLESMGGDPVKTAMSQIQLMETFWGTRIHAMSSHLPMRTGKTLKIPGIIDVYDPLYIQEIKYVSDSTQRWREGVVTKLLGLHNHIHLLLHEYHWSLEGHGFDVQLLREANLKYRALYDRALANIAKFKEGLRLRAIKDAEFQRMRFRDSSEQ